eukprot:GCRY01003860.1.p1 GENE.GCRY01003860.1~~GCRY01003860.1.p1  ORF type:complete len:604 (+),score=113.60 GCRY01003860.1:260-2071(+)
MFDVLLQKIEVLGQVLPSFMKGLNDFAQLIVIYCNFAIGGLLILGLMFLAWRRYKRNEEYFCICHFCEGKNYFKPKQSSVWWLCCHCEQYNGFTSEGDYLYEVPEMFFNLHPKQFCVQAECNEENVLCATCQKKQEILVSRLSFLSEGVDSFGHTLQEKVAVLHREAQLCPTCQAIVEYRLGKKFQAVAEWIKRNQLNSAAYPQEAVSSAVLLGRYSDDYSLPRSPRHLPDFAVGPEHRFWMGRCLQHVNHGARRFLSACQLLLFSPFPFQLGLGVAGGLCLWAFLSIQESFQMPNGFLSLPRLFCDNIQIGAEDSLKIAVALLGAQGICLKFSSHIHSFYTAPLLKPNSTTSSSSSTSTRSSNNNSNNNNNHGFSHTVNRSRSAAPPAVFRSFAMAPLLTPDTLMALTLIVLCALTLSPTPMLHSPHFQPAFALTTALVILLHIYRVGATVVFPLLSLTRRYFEKTKSPSYHLCYDDDEELHTLRPHMANDSHPLAPELPSMAGDQPFFHRSAPSTSHAARSDGGDSVSDTEMTDVFPPPLLPNDTTSSHALSAPTISPGHINLTTAPPQHPVSAISSTLAHLSLGRGRRGRRGGVHDCAVM